MKKWKRKEVSSGYQELLPWEVVVFTLGTTLEISERHGWENGSGCIRLKLCLLHSLSFLFLVEVRAERPRVVFGSRHAEQPLGWPAPCHSPLRKQESQEARAGTRNLSIRRARPLARAKQTSEIRCARGIDPREPWAVAEDLASDGSRRELARSCPGWSNSPFFVGAGAMLEDIRPALLDCVPPGCFSARGGSSFDR